MKISSRFSVAVHMLALIDYEQHQIQSRCTSENLADSVNTHPVVIRQIMRNLKKAGFVGVRSGPGGAYLLKPLEQITLLDVYHAVDVVGEGELFQIHPDPNSDCPIGSHIQPVLELILTKAQCAMEQVLAEITMHELVQTLLNKAR